MNKEYLISLQEDLDKAELTLSALEIEYLELTFNSSWKNFWNIRKIIKKDREIVQAHNEWLDLRHAYSEAITKILLSLLKD